MPLHVNDRCRTYLFALIIMQAPNYLSLIVPTLIC